MGASLALEAVGYCNQMGIAPVPRNLLLFMALRALDDQSGSPAQPARRSFMRRAELGVGIGRTMADRQPAADAPEAERLAWDADDKAIVRALRSLREADAIREVSHGHNGRTSEYVINLGQSQFGGIRWEDRKRHPSKDTNRHPTGHPASPNGDSQRHPKEDP